MSVFVQLGQSPGPVSTGAQYRTGFRRYVEASADRAVDHVLIVDPSPYRVARLIEDWRVWPQADVRQVHVGAEPQAERTARYFAIDEDGSPDPVVTPNPDFALTCYPNGTLRELEVPLEGLAELLAGVAVDGSIALLSVDLAALEECAWERVDWQSLSCARIAVTWGPGQEGSPRPRPLAVLRDAGYRPAGRPWGDAGTGVLLVRSGSVRDNVVATAGDLRVRLGEVVVAARSLIPSAAQARAQSERLRHNVRRSRGTSDVIDYSFGQPLSKVDPQWVYSVARQSREAARGEWHLDRLDEQDPAIVAHACRSEHGVWPVSFSYPKPMLAPSTHPDIPLSYITPGFPYSFDSEDDYLQSYRRATLGLTHRKAGWDCFRHVEILASGAAPLMLDVADIPQFSMVHYPKRAMTRVLQEALAGRLPSLQTRELLHRHTSEHLTSTAMASYLLEAAGLAGAARVLFVDERLPHAADYLSLMTLLGLKQILGGDCTVAFPVPYVYADSTVDSSSLYGRGFGYARALPVELRSAAEHSEGWAAQQDVRVPPDVEVLVVGSISRNRDIARRLLARFPAQQTIWIHGEDGPPSRAEMHEFHAAGTHTFVRAIEPIGSRPLRGVGAYANPHLPGARGAS